MRASRLVDHAARPFGRAVSAGKARLAAHAARPFGRAVSAGKARLAAWLDRMLFAHPFEGRSARRYAAGERPGFGDLDDRLLDGWTPQIVRARTLLELGCGPATFALRAAARFPHLAVIALDPSRDFARQHASLFVARAAGEALPLADASIDTAVCLSSIRHVRDRGAVLRELRRVVRGGLWIVELDPAASRARIAAHAERMSSLVSRHTFGPIVVGMAPSADAIAASAVAAGWRVSDQRVDPIQPVYILELV